MGQKVLSKGVYYENLDHWSYAIQTYFSVAHTNKK